MSAARGIPAADRRRDPAAPTPQNTPAAHLSASEFSRPHVPDTIGEDDDEDDIPVISSGGPGGVASQLASHPLLASIVQDRLGNLVGRSSGYIESLPPAVRQRVDGLQGIQVEHAKIEAEFQKEVLELEKKYHKLYIPLYERRLAIVTGAVEPTPVEVEAGIKAEEADRADEDEGTDEEKRAERTKPTAEDLAATKGVPGFWLTALGNHLGISDLITERDEAALKHLIDVTYDYLEGRPGFKLTFVFDEGAKEFFSNEKLEKTYFYQNEVGYGGEFVYEKAEGTTIDWAEGRDLTTKIETKKQRNKNTNQTRIVKKVVPTDSFFNFFKPPKVPSPSDDLDDDEEDAVEEKLELDYQMGEDLKERIIPRAIDFFTGKALRFESGGEDDFSDDYDDADFDDDDDDDDEDEPVAGRLGVPGSRKVRKAPVPPTGVTPASNQDPQECKQQ